MDTGLRAIMAASLNACTTCTAMRKLAPITSRSASADATAPRVKIGERSRAMGLRGRDDRRGDLDGDVRILAAGAGNGLTLMADG